MQSQRAIGVSMSATVTASVSPTLVGSMIGIVFTALIIYIPYLWPPCKILYLEYYDHVNYVPISFLLQKLEREGQGRVTS